jgi:cellobiose-specific phosphotransferase system component IIA
MAADEAVSAETWAQAQILYEGKTAKIPVIAAMVGLAAIQLSNEAKARGWKMRTAPARAKAAAKPAPLLQSSQLEAPPDLSETAATDKPEKPKRASRKAKPAANPSALRPIVLVRRVYKTIDGELTKLEKQEGASSQDRERASRALSQMVNSLEKAVEMQREITKDTAKGSGSKNKQELAHAEDLRRTVAERIQRLHEERLAAEGYEQPE